MRCLSRSRFSVLLHLTRFEASLTCRLKRYSNVFNPACEPGRLPASIQQLERSAASARPDYGYGFRVSFTVRDRVLEISLQKSSAGFEANFTREIRNWLAGVTGPQFLFAACATGAENFAVKC